MVNNFTHYGIDYIIDYRKLLTSIPGAENLLKFEFFLQLASCLCKCYSHNVYILVFECPHTRKNLQSVYQACAVDSAFEI